MSNIKRKVAIIVSVSAAILLVVFIVGFFLPGRVGIATTTSGFISTTVHYYETNPLFGIKIPDPFDKPDLQDEKELQEHDLEKVYERVRDVDGDVFYDPYADMQSCFFELDRYVYYFRTEDAKHFYRWDRNNGEIRACELFALNKRMKYGSSWGHEVNRNSVLHISLTLEALLDQYPGLENAIDSINGEFYCRYVFFEKGRIFFEKQNTIYEYLPATDSVQKIVSVGPGETVKRIYPR